MTPEQRVALSMQDSYFLLMPLDASGGSVGAHARRMARLLRDRSLPSPSAHIIGHLVKLYDHSAAAHQLACKKGCHYCCRQKVVLSAPEVFFLASRISPSLLPSLTTAAQTCAGLSADQYRALWPVCPLIENGACSAYAARPLGCHAFGSIDVQPCLTLFEAREPADIPLPLQHVVLLRACRVLLHAAQRLAGLPTTSYELTGALVRALTTKDAEKRWLSGEDVFAGLEDETTVPPDVEREIAAIVNFVQPTL